MNNKIEAEFIDQSFVNIKIPFKDIHGIITDIENLFKHKDKSGKYNIGATGVSIELIAVLKRMIAQRNFILSLEVKKK